MTFLDRAPKNTKTKKKKRKNIDGVGLFIYISHMRFSYAATLSSLGGPQASAAGASYSGRLAV